MTYYDRAGTVHVDGSPLFKTADDEAAEHSVAARLESAWSCEVRSFGRLAPLDWYAVRDGRLVGVLELKTRSHEATKYATVFLNVRKYLALMLGAVGLGVPAIFVAHFVDDLRWVNVATIDGTAHRIGGCVRLVKSRSDVEPVIEVPVASMFSLNNP
jgi:hypothetical protein